MWPLLRKVKNILKFSAGYNAGKNSGDKQKVPEDASELDGLPLTANLSERVALIKKVMGESLDLVIRELVIGDESRAKAAVVYIDGMIDNKTVFDHILNPLMFESQSIKTGEKLPPARVFQKLIESRLSAGEMTVQEKNSLLFSHLTEGDTIILVDGHLPFISVRVRTWEDRNIDEPENESVVRGPRDGFIETLKVNMSLVRRRLKTPSLKFETHNIGNTSRTTVVVGYLENIANPKLVREVRERLERIDTDAIVSVGYLEDYIEDNPYSPFPQTKATERPDIVTADLLEGRVTIMADNTPFSLIIPTTFFEQLQGADDYYQRPWFGAVMVRLLRLIAINIALVLPSIYVAVTTFHQELIPTPLLISIAGAREEVPFPAVVEALLMESVFELLREAGLRLPAPIGTAVSIVGALVLGDAAVRAGIVSPAMVIVVALTAIASFSIPGFAVALSLRQMRFPLILLAASLGLFGVMFGLLVILIHLASLRSFGVPYMAPLAPLMPRDLKDIFGRPPQWAMGKRPRYMRTRDPVRQGENLKPRPPDSRDKS